MSKKFDFGAAKRFDIRLVLEDEGYKMKRKKSDNSWTYESSTKIPTNIAVWRTPGGDWMFKGHPCGTHGTVVDLSKLFVGDDWKKRFKWLEEKLSITATLDPSEKPVVKSDAVPHRKRPVEDLIKSAQEDVFGFEEFKPGVDDIHKYLEGRGIHFVDQQFSGSVFSKANHAIAFAYRDADMNIIAYERRFSGSSNKYYTKGSPAGVFVSRDYRDGPTIAKIHIFESAVEALSHRAFFGFLSQDFDEDHTLYLALRSGSEEMTAELVAKIAERSEDEGVDLKVELNFNNDAAGAKYAVDMFTHIHVKTEKKVKCAMQLPLQMKNDWNDMLVDSKIDVQEMKDLYSEYKKHVAQQDPFYKDLEMDAAI